MNAELRQWITNIPRNGEWSSPDNLLTYLEMASAMSKKGFSDREILSILTALFKAAVKERDAELEE